MGNHKEEIKKLRDELVKLRETLEKVEAESKKSFEKILDSLPDPVFIESIDGRILFANKAAEKLLGYTKEELRRMNASELIPEESRDKMDEVIRQLEKEGSFRVLAKNRKKTGEIVDVDVSGTFIDYLGEKAVIVVVKDVTEQIKIKEDLELNYQRYETLFNTTNIGIWYFETKQPIPVDLPINEQIKLMFDYGYLKQCNDAMAKMYGYERAEEIIGKPLKELLIPEDPANIEYLKNFIESGYKTFDAESHEIDASGNDKYFINSFFGMIKEGKLTGAWGIQIDITEQRKLRNALENTSKQMSAILNSMSEAVIYHEPNMKIIWANKATSEYLDIPYEKIIGKYCYKLMGLDKVCPGCPVVKAVETGEPCEGMVMKPGLLDWYIRAYPIFDADGNLKGVVEVAENITEKEQMRKINEAIFKISEATHTTESLDELFKEIHSIISTLMPAENFYISLYYPEKNTISFPYFVDEYDENPGEIPLGKTLTAYVIRTNEALLASPEVTEELAEKGEVELVGAPSIDWLGVPLKINGETIGVLVLQSYTEGVRFTEEHKRIIQFVSDQIAMAIQRKKAEEALKESEELFRTLVEKNLVGVYLLQGDTFIYANPVVCEITEYDLSEMKNMKLKNIVHPDDYEVVASRAAARLRGEDVPASYEFRIVTKSGKVKWVKILASRIILNGVPTILGTVEDITEQRKVRQELESEREKLAVTLRSIGDGVITTDTEGKIQMMNKVAERLTGWSEEEAIGRDIMEVLNILDEQTEEPLGNPVKRTLETHGAIHVAESAILVCKDGSRKIISDSAAPIHRSDSTILGVVMVFRDITKERMYEKEILHADKLRSLEIMAGGIAHDFNNILMGIMGYISLAKSYTQEGDKLYKLLTEAEAATEQARDLTNQLLTFARSMPSVKEVIELPELIKQVTEFSLRGSNVKPVFNISEDLWTIEADRAQIGQVIRNLIINADHAMPRGGVVEVSAENVEIKVEDKTKLDPGPYVKITVRDYGIGIPPEHIPRIFEPFFTTKHKGSGLGLAVCYSIIKNHNGHIEVESELGKGTTFYIYLPAIPTKRPEKKREEQRALYGEGKILIMEDEETVRDVLGLMLDSMGYSTEFAVDGEEAIRKYKEAMEAGEPFEVVIMDLTIRGGMGGKETIKKILEIDPYAKVIASSGYSNDPIISDYKNYGFKGVLIKPYKVQNLAKVLRNVLLEE